MIALILGGSGMLGQAFTSTLVRAGAQVLAPSHQELDITDEISVRRYIKKIGPHVVINCVGLTNVDLCEAEPARAYLINSDAVEYAASAAKKVKSKFIHIGTDYVFNGIPGEPYKETDVPNPLQVYGKSKLQGEVRALENGGMVFRVQWLFGNGRSNFVDWVAKSLIQGKKIPIAAQQAGSPCSALFVAHLVSVAIHSCKKEIYHITHENYCNRFECAKYIAEYLKKDWTQLFEPMKDVAFGLAARPVDTRLCPDKIKAALGVRTLGTWEADVLTYVSSRYNTWIP